MGNALQYSLSALNRASPLKLAQPGVMIGEGRGAARGMDERKFVTKHVGQRRGQIGRRTRRLSSVNAADDRLLHSLPPVDVMVALTTTGRHGLEDAFEAIGGPAAHGRRAGV